MRGTVAKRLRREAERRTKGMPERKLMWKGRQGIAIAQVNHGASTRVVYREMKRRR